jgi:Ni,Fe-hydrogenase I cytochrome b subunit
MVGIVETGIGIWALIRHQQIYALPEKVVRKAVDALRDVKNEDIWHRMHIRVCIINV